MKSTVFHRLIAAAIIKNRPKIVAPLFDGAFIRWRAIVKDSSGFWGYYSTESTNRVWRFFDEIRYLFFCNYQRIYILSAIISMQTDDNEGRVKVVGAHTHIEIIVNFTALSVGVCCVTGEIWWWSRRLYEVKSWNQTQVVFTFLCGPDVATCLVQINAWEIQILKLIIIEECNSVMTAAYPSLTQSTTASTRGSHGHRPKSQLPKWGKVTLV